MTANSQEKLSSLRLLLRDEEVNARTLKGKVDDRQAKVDGLSAELETITTRKAAAEEAAEKVAGDLELTKNEYVQVKSELTRVRQLYAELEAKMYEAASNLENAKAGIAQSDKEALRKENIGNMKRMYPPPRGVQGMVGDLCKPKQKKYDEAVHHSARSRL